MVNIMMDSRFNASVLQLLSIAEKKKKKNQLALGGGQPKFLFLKI
jgi:hypothetical protein